MDDSTFNSESAKPDLPDGLVHFRMNLVELLVDICQILKSTTFIQKVINEESFFFLMCIQ